MAGIIDLLVKLQILDEREHDSVMSRAKSQAGGHIVQQVAELGYATESSMARAISVELGLPRIDIGITPPEPAALQLLDARTCAERFVLPVALRENGELLWLAMADPTDQDSIIAVSRKSNRRVRPAVAGPTEILRAVRQLYSAPVASTAQPEKVGSEHLADIETASAGSAFEVVNVAEEVEGKAAAPGPETDTALSRIARELGVEVPANIPSRSVPPRRAPAPEVPEPQTKVPEPEMQLPDPELQIAVKPAPAIPPRTDPRAQRPPSFDELFSPAAASASVQGDDLTPEDLATLDALRASMEKGALVLRALAELCVEKGIFTREEMRKRSAKSAS